MIINPSNETKSKAEPKNSLLSDIALEDMGLDDSLVRGCKKAGFTHFTAIQAQSLPIALQGRDVSGQAQTGTGKTAAFLLACYHHLLQNPAHPKRKANQPRALILAPTRELALQIHKDATTLGMHSGLRHRVAYGGTGYERQREEILSGVDILIGTPGRLIDYFKQGVYHLKYLQVAVLDEVDRMFDLGFIRDVRYLFQGMPAPEKRLSMMFSATLSSQVTELSHEYMNKPKLLRIKSDRVTVDSIEQSIYHPSNQEKIILIIGLLQQQNPSRAMIFTNTKREAEKLLRYLQYNGFDTGVLSGDVPQLKRQRLLQRFSEGKLALLVATDVAARGLHISDVSHVFNYDLPHSAEDYVHRIGRTARAGASGKAISLACENHAFSLPAIEKFIRGPIPFKPITEDLLPQIKRPPRKPQTSRNHGHRSASSFGGATKKSAGGAGGNAKGAVRTQNRAPRRSNRVRRPV